MRRTVSGAAEPRMSAGGERKLAATVFAGAIIIARSSAVAYRMHTYIYLSSRPRFALGPFSFENCCYRGSPVHDLAGASIVGQCSLKQLPERPRAGDNFGLGAPPILELGE
jgi:hypothetical protein